MPIPAILAARLAGRPLLMRPEAVPGYARLLGVDMEPRAHRSGLAVVMDRARRLIRADSERETPHRTAPEAYAPRWMGEPEAIGFGWTLKQGVALINVDGPLLAEGFGWGDCWYHGYDTLMQACEEVYADARVRGVMFRKNSPGGVCAPGLPELADFIRANRELSGGKPTWAFCEGSYSADYWTSTSCDWIVAPREGGVGSIGAVATWCGVSGALESDGLEVRQFTFGAKKADGSPYAPLSDTAEADIQAEVNQFGRWFVAGVHAGRPQLSEQAILATEAGCYLGDADEAAYSGLAQGLVDQVMTEREAFAALCQVVA